MDQIDQTKDEEQIARDKASHFGVEYVKLRGINISTDVLNMVPEDIARKNQLVVYKKEGNKIFIAIADADRLKQKAPEILTKLKKDGYNFKIGVTTQGDLQYALLGYKQKNNKINKKQEDKNIVDKQGVQSSQNLTDIETIDLKSLGSIKASVLSKIPEKIAKKYRIIVFESSADGKEVKMAIEDPENLQTQEIVNFIATRNNIKVKQYKTDEASVNWALELYSQVAPEEEIQKNVETQEAESKKDNTELPKKKDEKPKEDLSKKEIIKEKVKQEPEIKKEKPIEKVQVADISGEVKEVPEQEKLTTKVAISESEQNLDNLLDEKITSINALIEIIKAGSIPKIVAATLGLAVNMEASDVHIEADERNLKLRYRVDGILKEIVKMPLTLQAPIISRIKILSKLKIDEQRIPQDGRFDIQVSGKSIDLRVSTMPTIHGETCVMRLLDKTTGIIEFEKLGLYGVNLDKTRNAIKKPYGIIFVTGPTGSGKTTTLYSMLNILNKPDVNIVTLEDPVEYELPGINQSQIKPKIGFDFANGLRSILRQDPNIIMVGEVRDTETANMTTHAALTGHLVLSTLHTNDSTGALPRLVDMGVEPYLITSSINVIVAQRLVRRLCDKCKQEANIPEKVLNNIKKVISSSNDPDIKSLANEKLKFYKPKGCPICKDGYKGRIGLFEVLEINDRIEQLAVNRASASVIRRAAFNQGLVSILEDGYYKAIKGMTTIDEVIRVAKTK